MGRPKGSKNAGERRKRECLKCGRKFLSKGKANRLCWYCNKENELVKEMDIHRISKDIKRLEG